MTFAFRFDVTDAPGPAIYGAIYNPLAEFGNRRAGNSDARPLAITITNENTGSVIGGIWGISTWRWLFVEVIFVPDELRGVGIGKKLMHMAEDEAKERGCIGIWLDTFDFQAPGFYEKLGYEVFGQIKDHPPGHTLFFLQKRL